MANKASETRLKTAPIDNNKVVEVEIPVTGTGMGVLEVVGLGEVDAVGELVGAGVGVAVAPLPVTV